MQSGSAQSPKNEKEGSLLRKLIGRWSEIAECRALLEAFCLCSFLPVTIGLLFHYDKFAPETTQVNKADLEYLASLLIFAPVGETLLLFVPFFELSRKYRLKNGLAVLSFSVLFELLHWHRSWAEHAWIFPTGFFFCVLYVSSRERSFLHAFVFTIFIHMTYNFTILVIPVDWFGYHG